MISEVQAATDMWYPLFLSEMNKRAPSKTKRIKYAHVFNCFEVQTWIILFD
jgi:hypothetical protein